MTRHDVGLKYKGQVKSEPKSWVGGAVGEALKPGSSLGKRAWSRFVSLPRPQPLGGGRVQAHLCWGPVPGPCTPPWEAGCERETSRAFVGRAPEDTLGWEAAPVMASSGPGTSAAGAVLRSCPSQRPSDPHAILHPPSAPPGAVGPGKGA